MKEYSPKRRTAVVFTGTGTSGAYHAGVLKALDESGAKLDLVVGSGVGTVAAAFAAVSGGAKLYGPGGFWEDVGWRSFYRLRLFVRVALLLFGTAFGVFLLPLMLAALAGLLFPLILIADLVAPGAPSRLLGDVWVAPAVLRAPYVAALAIPSFGLSLLAVVVLGRAAAKGRRRISEFFEAILEAEPARSRLRRTLWDLLRGSALPGAPLSEAELGRRYVALASENLGQPGFRELILRVADLDTGAALPFALLHDGPRASFAAVRSRGPRSRPDGIPGAVDLREAGCDVFLFDAVLTGLLPPGITPVRRVLFPKGGPHAGETHRLADATLIAGSGVAAAIAAGAEQIIVVSATPEATALPARRRGPRALADAILATLERQAVERDVETTERTNRMVETLGHRTEDGGRAWQDPATGRLYRDVGLYVVRPKRRVLGPLEMDGSRDPSSEVVETPGDLVERGYRDAYRLFVEPVVGAAPAPGRAAAVEPERQPVEL